VIIPWGMNLFLILSLPAAAVAYFSLQKRVAQSQSIKVPIIVAGFITSLAMIIYWGVLPRGAQQWGFFTHWYSITIEEFLLYSVPVLLGFLMWKGRSRSQEVLEEELFWAFFSMFVILTIRDVASARANWGFFHLIHVPILRLIFLLIVPRVLTNIFLQKGSGRVTWIISTIIIVAVLGLAANLGRLNLPVYSIPLTSALFIFGIFMRLNQRLLKA
jgi:hypothetical protein